jgi:hypothetical protein
MTNLEIVVPFALPPAEHAKDLLAALQARALARLLARASLKKSQSSPAFAPALAHECWLAKINDQSPPLAHSVMQQLGMRPESGYWFLLQPASLHIARDHLVLTDLRQLRISEDESRQLFKTAESLCSESGMTLVYGNAHTWFLRADQWRGLQTCTPDAACGHNIDIWLPKGEGERDWRRLQNELQMSWHTDVVNEQRDMRGALRINTAWLWGGSADQANASTGLQAMSGTTLRLATPVKPDQLKAGQTLLLEQLIAPALAGDWSKWLANYAALDSQYFAPLLENLINGSAPLNLVLTDSSRLMQWQISRNAMRKFWCPPSLKRLVS